ncbi:MAG: glycosyltransferase family 39 protein, partial [Dehalococcoidia bacterium]|nr:glycosyltransferase family 39 protein [Dehalococcoidia bacterium]
MQNYQGPGRRPFPFVLGIILLTLLAFFLRAYRIDWQSLWVDENFTVILSAKDLASITQITSGDVHPPLYYYLVHFWLQLTGQSEFSLRFLSLVFSLLFVPLVFKLGSQLVNRRVGIIAAFLGAIGPFQVYYAQEARMYSLMVMLSLLSTYAMARVAGFGTISTQSVDGLWRVRSRWATVIVSSALLLYVHYFGALVLLFQSSVILLARIRQRGLVIRWCLSQVAVLALFSPWIPVMMRTYVTNDEEWRRFIPFLPMFQDTMVSLSLGESTEQALYLALASGFFLALLIGIAALAWRKRSRPLLLFLGLYMFQPILITYAMSHSKPVFGASRYLIFVAPAFYVLVSIGLVSLRDRWRPLFVALLSCLVLASGYSLGNNYFNDSFAKDDYRALARAIEASAKPEDGLVIMNGVVFDYYYKGSTPRIYLPQQYPLNQLQVIDSLNGFSRGKSRLWMLQWMYNGTDPDDFIFHQLEDHAQMLEDRSIRGLRYTLFKLDPEASFGAGIQRPLAVSFENGLSAVGYSLNSDRVAAGQTLNVTLYMKANAKLDQDYKVSLFLSDSRGYRWAQNDKSPTGYSMSRWRVGELVETRLPLTVPLGIPPGEYSLGAVIYSPTSLQPITVFDSRQTPMGTTLPLSVIRVGKGTLPYPLTSLGSSQRIDRDLAPGIRLLSYELDAGEVGQGGNINLSLYWQALSQPRSDYSVQIRLMDNSGNSVQEFSEAPNHGLYPTRQWSAGEIVRDIHTLQIGGATAPGKVTIDISLNPDGSQAAEIGSLVVKERPRSFTLPAIQKPGETDLGGSITFEGYALGGDPFRPGSKMSLTLYWKAKAGGLGNYAVFAHLLDSQNRIWGQSDGPPEGGNQPTSSWLAGQVITDLRQFSIKPDAPPGEYLLEIGMYDPATGARLKVANGEDRILLEKVE